MSNKLRFAFYYFLLIALLGACGDNKSSNNDGGSSQGEVTKIFLTNAEATNIPPRILMAIAYLESRLSIEQSSAIYPTTNAKGEVEKKSKNLSFGQTMFGVSAKELGLEPNQNINFQVDAYSKWLNRKLGSRTKDLVKNPQEPDELFAWIWNIAQLHRSGKSERPNLWILFSLELMEVLNKGFIWQDAKTGETINFEPQQKELSKKTLRRDNQLLLEIRPDNGDIPGTQYIRLATISNSTQSNQPKSIVITHCPFSLSACLDLQVRKDKETVMQSHFIVPSNFDIVPRIIQTHFLPTVVENMNEQGENVPYDNQIVITLVGNSGRYVNGKRSLVDATWLTQNQLSKTSELINDLCFYLSEKGYVDSPTCLNSLQFKNNAAEYRWSDIPDFDPFIFKSLKTSGQTAIDFPSHPVDPTIGGSLIAVNPGENFQLRLMFQNNVREVVLQRLVRCQDGSVRWNNIRNDPVRNVTEKLYDLNLFDGGVNSNGEHYFRVMNFDQNNDLLAWNTQKILVKNFEKGETPSLAPQVCRN